MYGFILEKKKNCCYSYNSVKVLESPGISSKVLEKSWNFDAKSEKKVLEFEIFLVGTVKTVLSGIVYKIRF